MPGVEWGISKGTLTNYERSAFKPYDGAIPPNGVYRFKLKRLVYKAGTGASLPQLHIGTELVARRGRNDKQYTGFYITTFQAIGDNNVMFWGPFLDALGVSEAEFRTATKIDTDGNIRQMGKWKNDGNVHLMGLIKDDTDMQGKPRKAISWWGADVVEDSSEDDEEYDDDDEEFEDEEYDDDDLDEEEGDEEDWDDEEEEPEPVPAPKRRVTRKR